MYYIYKLRNKITKECYVGLTNDLHKRLLSHKSFMNNTDRRYAKNKLYDSMRKYGIDNFDYSVIDHALTAKEGDQKEKYWINFYDTIMHGLNIFFGGKYTENKKKKRLITIFISKDNRDWLLNNKTKYGITISKQMDIIIKNAMEEEERTGSKLFVLNRPGELLKAV